MKIGIISSYAFIKNNNNYGALLQYFALQTYLQQYGHEVFWIRTVLYHNTPKFLLKKLYHLKSLRLFFNWIVAHHGFMDFIRNNLNVSKIKYSSFEHISQNPPPADVYITGSDQVWGNDKLKENYLLFAPKRKTKLAYAASFGRDEIPTDMAKTIKPWLEDFSAISVREKTGVDICLKMGILAEHLLDPTLLLEAKNYPIASKSRFKKPYIYCYFLNLDSPNSTVFEFVKKFAKDNNFDIHVCAVQGAEKYIDKNYLVSPTPEEWLTDYHHADYIVTNTFHGTVFALINHRNFVTIAQKGASAKQNNRMQSLLTSFSLSDHLTYCEEEISQILKKEINWDSFESIRNANVDRAQLFFNSNLKML